MGAPRQHGRRRAPSVTSAVSTRVALLATWAACSASVPAAHDAAVHDAAVHDAPPDDSRPATDAAAPPPTCPTCDLFGHGYPLAFFFRACEIARPYDEWNAAFGRLMGIEGKALDEAIPGRGANAAVFTRFKEEHPDQLVLLHFHGRARDPRFDSGAFSAGNWLYHVGSRVLDDVPAETGDTAIRVENPGRFRVDVGSFGNAKDDVVVCALLASGQPDWNTCEQTALVSVDIASGTIVVRRAQYGTTSLAFAGGQAYAAAHAIEGPPNAQANLLWMYNYSTAAPAAPDGRRTPRVLAEDLAARFQPGGALAAFDGVEFDVLMFEPPRDESGRARDFDGDGAGDNAVVDGVNTYGVGVRNFTARLRAALPDKLILADGVFASNQRAFGVLNGIESEGWPHLRDTAVADWSGGMNRVGYWNAAAHAPALSYVNHKLVDAENRPADVPSSVDRLVMAAAMFLDAAVTFTRAPAAELDEPVIGIWDELVKGADRELGWLGRPLAPARLPATEQPDQLADGPGIGAALAARVRGPGIETSLAGGGTLTVTATSAGATDLTFSVRDVAVEGPDLLVVISAHAEALAGHPAEVARLATMRLAIPAGASGTVPDTTIMAWVGPRPVGSQFYFKGVAADRVDLEIQVEGAAAFHLDEIAVHAHPAVELREFERGIVLANPSDAPYEFDLAALSDQRTYRRLRASSLQDPGTNDGRPVGARITLPAMDAVFLALEP